MKNTLLVVIDMQNDFCTGSLANPDAVAIIPTIKSKLESGLYSSSLFTRDTHQNDYLQTPEGKKLPVTHCVEDTEGWQIVNELAPYADNVLNKPTFGFKDWESYLNNFYAGKDLPDEIELCGTCTDICVVSNALALKAIFPNIEITVDSKACAGLSPQKHEAALETMRSCQINVM